MHAADIEDAYPCNRSRGLIHPTALSFGELATCWGEDLRHSYLGQPCECGVLSLDWARSGEERRLPQQHICLPGHENPILLSQVAPPHDRMRMLFSTYDSGNAYAKSALRGGLICRSVDHVFLVLYEGAELGEGRVGGGPLPRWPCREHPWFGMLSTRYWVLYIASHRLGVYSTI